MELNQTALETLVGRQRALWRTETRHEAMLLMGALYKRQPSTRDEIVAHVLSGSQLTDLSLSPERIEALEFEFLGYLEGLGESLPARAAERLAAIRQRHPKWAISKYPGMSHWTESGWVGKRVQGEDILSLSASEGVSRLRNATDTFTSSRREMAEAFGVALAKNWDWGKEALRHLGEGIAQFVEEQLNPIWWGLRAAITENKEVLSITQIRELFELLQELVQRRPEPAIWASVPSVLQELVKRRELDVKEWNGIARDLANVFWCFDFEREETPDKPIEWLDRAINHPYGDLTEIYRDLAATRINQLIAEKAPPVLPIESKEFFEYTLTKQGLGSRYGLCLIAEGMSWLEGVDETFVNAKLRPFFDWNKSPIYAQIAWSGFLWSRTLSKTLADSFEGTYLETAKHIDALGEDERKGLASHVAAVFWFGPRSVGELLPFATAVDSRTRLEMLDSWKTHLQQADAGLRTEFVKRLLAPYWDWCSRQPFFANNDRERTEFIELAPYWEDAFPDAVQRAVKYSPASIENTYSLLSSLSDSSAVRFSDEFVDLLVKILEVSRNPDWEDDEWKKLWHKLEFMPHAKRELLRNALAIRGIDVGDQVRSS